jgi:hypothetical protein
MNTAVTTPAPAAIQTPLQDALLADGGDALHADRTQRLGELRDACRRHADSGLAPAAYAQAQQLLAACEAGLRVLSTQPRVGAGARGPAAGLPR